MRRTLTIALGTAAALATAAVAFAVVSPVVGVSKATAEFSTNKVDKLSTSSCTAGDGTIWQVTRAHYTGLVIGAANPILNGPLTIHAKTTTVGGLGFVEGSFKVRDDDSRLSGKFSGTLDGTTLVGFLTAKSKGNHAKVLGNISATFNPNPASPDFAAFSGGKLGSTASGALAVVAGPVCKTPKPPKSDKPKGVHAHGTYTLAGGTITVTDKKSKVTGPCVIPSGFVMPPGLVTTSSVHMKCAWEGTVLTLKELKLHK